MGASDTRREAAALLCNPAALCRCLKSPMSPPAVLTVHKQPVNHADTKSAMKMGEAEMRRRAQKLLILKKG